MGKRISDKSEKNQSKAEENPYAKELKKLRDQLADFKDLYQNYNENDSLDFLPQKIKGLE